MKKKLFILCVLVFIVGICFAANTSIMPIDLAGERVDPGAVQTARPEWVAIDASTSAGDEPTDLAVTERTYQTVKAAQIANVSGDGEIAIYDVPRGWNAIRLRAQGITDGGTYTVQIYAGTLGDGKRDTDYTSASTFDCELAYVGQLAWTVGTQGAVTATYEMADTLVVTESDWTKEWTSTSPTGNRVAEATIDIMGADLIVIVPTVVSADSKLLARGF
jgi:hypothetical protein